MNDSQDSPVSAPPPSGNQIGQPDSQNSQPAKPDWRVPIEDPPVRYGTGNNFAPAAH